MKNSLEYIAFENGLEIVESTSELSGYPKNIKPIIYGGLETFDEARSLAEKYDLDIIYVKRHFGQDLWSRCGNVYEPFNTCDFLNENEGWLGKTTYSSRQQFYQQFVRPELEDAGEDIIEDATSLRIFAENCEAIQNELEDMNDDEILVYRTDHLFDEDFSVDTRPETCMEIEEDSTEYAIALIDYVN